MKRFFLGLVLLVVILISFSFAILRLLANGPEDSWFNTQYRAQVAAYPWLRHALRLNSDGDARADYLSDRYNRIIVEVDVMQGLEISDAALDLLKSKMEKISGKEVLIARSSEIPYSQQVNDENIKEFAKVYKNYSVPGTAKIYLLYLSEFETNIDNLGSTYQEDGILLFDSSLRSFTAQSPDTLDYYVESTALHEFGHQMGLPHNDRADCLMAAEAEHGRYGIESPSDVIVDFCDYEKNLIQAN